jgi:cell division protein FtsB
MSERPESPDAPTPIDPSLAAMLFDETGEEGGEEPSPGAETRPAGHGLLARLKGLFSRREKVVEKADEAAPAAIEASGESATEEAPRRRFSAKKWLFVGLPILLLALAGGGVLYAFKRMEAAKEAEVARQLAELKAKQAELEKQKAELEALKRQEEKQAEASREAAAKPPQGKPEAARTAQDDGPVDCTVTKSGEDAAQTLKRCIDAYNRATGR